jgi:hypothetical protein
VTDEQDAMIRQAAAAAAQTVASYSAQPSNGHTRSLMGGDTS